MKTNGIKIKDFAKAAAKTRAGKDTRIMLSPGGVLTDGRMALNISKLSPEDRAALMLPVTVPIMPAYVNCTTEEQAAKNNADIKAAGLARDAANAHNTAVVERLALLSGLSAEDCSTLPAESDKIFNAPAKLRAFRFTGLIYAPAVGTGEKVKQEVCIFEELGESAAAVDHSGVSYNMSNTNGRAVADYAKELEKQREMGRAAAVDAFNEPEAPRTFTAAGGFFREDNRAPGALRQIGINRRYVEFLNIGAALVFIVVWMFGEADGLPAQKLRGRCFGDVFGLAHD